MRSERSPVPTCAWRSAASSACWRGDLLLVQARAQDAHRLLAVLQLGLLVLHGDHEAGRLVRDAHRGVGRVHRLPAGAGRAVDVDLQVVLVDLDVDLLGLGQHRDRRGRGVDAALRLGRRHALDAMRAALPLEDGVGAVALDREGVVAVGALEDLGLEAAALGVAGEQPEQVAGPEVGLRAAGGALDLDDDVLVVVRVALDHREADLLLEALDVRARRSRGGRGPRRRRRSRRAARARPPRRRSRGATPRRASRRARAGGTSRPAAA